MASAKRFLFPFRRPLLRPLLHRTQRRSALFRACTYSHTLFLSYRFRSLNTAVRTLHALSSKHTFYFFPRDLLSRPTTTNTIPHVSVWGTMSCAGFCSARNNNDKGNNDDDGRVICCVCICLFVCLSVMCVLASSWWFCHCSSDTIVFWLDGLCCVCLCVCVFVCLRVYLILVVFDC